MTHELFVTIAKVFIDADDVDREKIDKMFQMRHSLRHDRSRPHGLNWIGFPYGILSVLSDTFTHMQHTAEDIMYVLTDAEIYEFTLRFSW